MPPQELGTADAVMNMMELVHCRFAERTGCVHCARAAREAPLPLHHTHRNDFAMHPLNSPRPISSQGSRRMLGAPTAARRAAEGPLLWPGWEEFGLA